ncbi:MAG: hypothetical protein K2N38_05495 [Oscillospiraceae bacterium]|nr:hypothetical protein [Oscillospiraceae bacterium]
MIGSIISEYRSYSVFIGTVKTNGADSSFDEMLAETEEEKLLKNAPDKWVSEPGIAHNAVCAAVEYRESELGIKITEPTHELTPAQREWLCSRHDLSTMKTHVRYSYDYGGTTQYRIKATPEYSNFCADLAYLGVYSADEFITVSPLDTRPGAHSTLTEYFNEVWNSDCSLLNTAKMVVKHLENMFNFYNERSKDPHKAIEGDAEFAALIKEHYMPINQKFFEFISGLIGNNDDEQTLQSGIAPIIEDCSEKLKEDFGSRM